MTYVPVNPPPPRRRMPLAAKVIIGVVAAVAIAIPVSLVVAISKLPDPGPEYATGDCALVTGNIVSPKMEKVDCGSGRQNYIVSRQTTTAEECGPDYTKVTKGEMKVCLIPNYADGECYKFTGLVSIELDMPEIACSEQHAGKVRVLEETTDKAACEPDFVDADVYPEIRTTICYSRPS